MTMTRTLAVEHLLVAAGREIRVRLAPGLDLIQGPWPARRAESRSGHERLIAALAAADAAAARDAMHEHVAATELAIRGILARHGVDLGTHETGAGRTAAVGVAPAAGGRPGEGRS